MQDPQNGTPFPEPGTAHLPTVKLLNKIDSETEQVDRTAVSIDTIEPMSEQDLDASIYKHEAELALAEADVVFVEHLRKSLQAEVFELKRAEYAAAERKVSEKTLDHETRTSDEYMQIVKLQRRVIGKAGVLRARVHALEAHRQRRRLLSIYSGSAA